MKSCWKNALSQLHEIGMIGEIDFICGVCHSEFRADDDVRLWTHPFTGEVMLLHEDCIAPANETVIEQVLLRKDLKDH